MRLRSLAVLHMHRGVIQGSSSSNSFSQLQQLQVLNVSHTDMSNEDLRQLQPLTGLRELYLDFTRITRPPLVSSLTRLEMANVEV